MPFWARAEIMSDSVSIVALPLAPFIVTDTLICSSGATISPAY